MTYLVRYSNKDKASVVLDNYIMGDNLAEAGRKLNLSRERSRQLFNKAISRELVCARVAGLDRNEIKNEIKSSHNVNRAAKRYKIIIDEKRNHALRKLKSDYIRTENGLIRILGLPKSSLHLISESYPELLSILAENNNKWSRHYDKCRYCATTDIEHKSWGYCKKCYKYSTELKTLKRKYYIKHYEETRERQHIYYAAHKST